MFHLRAPLSIVAPRRVGVGAEVFVDDRSQHGLFALHALLLIGGLGGLGYYFGPQVVSGVAAPAGRAIGLALGLSAGTALTAVIS